jgi:hypothetical protein
MASAILMEVLARGFMDDEGRPIAGGTVELYKAGTQDLADSWIDADKSSVHPNPLVLNARGAIIAYGDDNYRMIVKKADGTTVEDFDNVYYKYEGNSLSQIVSSRVITTADKKAWIPLFVEASEKSSDLITSANASGIDATAISQAFIELDSYLKNAISDFLDITVDTELVTAHGQPNPWETFLYLWRSYWEQEIILRVAIKNYLVNRIDDVESDKMDMVGGTFRGDVAIKLDSPRLRLIHEPSEGYAQLMVNVHGGFIVECTGGVAMDFGNKRLSGAASPVSSTDVVNLSSLQAQLVGHRATWVPTVTNIFDEITFNYIEGHGEKTFLSFSEVEVAPANRTIDLVFEFSCTIGSYTNQGKVLVTRAASSTDWDFKVLLEGVRHDTGGPAPGWSSSEFSIVLVAPNNNHVGLAINTFNHDATFSGHATLRTS